MLKDSCKDTIPAIKAYLAKIGRMKFIVPLYKQLGENELFKSWLGDFYRQHKPVYHPIAQVKIEKNLDKSGVKF